MLYLTWPLKGAALPYGELAFGCAKSPGSERALAELHRFVAQAIASGLMLVTNNQREFKRVAGLRIEIG